MVDRIWATDNYSLNLRFFNGLEFLQMPQFVGSTPSPITLFSYCIPQWGLNGRKYLKLVVTLIQKWYFWYAFQSRYFSANIQRNFRNWLITSCRTPLITKWGKPKKQLNAMSYLWNIKARFLNISEFEKKSVDIIHQVTSIAAICLVIFNEYQWKNHHLHIPNKLSI